MTYEEAENFLADNINLIGQYSKLKPTPFYIKHLLIVPTNSDTKTEASVYEEYLSNNFNNKLALTSPGLFNKDYHVVIVFEYGGLNPTYYLTDYLSELNKLL